MPNSVGKLLYHIFISCSHDIFWKKHTSEARARLSSPLIFLYYIFLISFFRCFWKCLSLLGSDGGEYYNLKWFVISCSEKSFKLIINIFGMSLNLVSGKLPEEHWCATLWGLEVPIAIIGKSWQAAALFK